MRHWCLVSRAFLDPLFPIWTTTALVQHGTTLQVSLWPRRHRLISYALFLGKTEEEWPASFINRCSLLPKAPSWVLQLCAPKCLLVVDSQRPLLTNENSKWLKRPSHGVILKQPTSMFHIYSNIHIHFCLQKDSVCSDPLKKKSHRELSQIFSF